MNDLGTVSVEAAANQAGGADRGTPLLAEQNGTSAATTLRQEDIARQPGTQNVAQQIGKVVGVNSYSRDASGLFGGGYSIRGFDSTQIGLSLNGVPLNDPGTFAVTPQVYTDSENLCSIDVNQGTSAGAVAQHGAVGGQVSMSQCVPTDTPKTMVSQSFGSYNNFKSFIRANTGLMYDDALKGYISYSHAQSDYFVGPGAADRHHVDGRLDLKLEGGSSLTVTSFYNLSENTYIRNITKSQYAAYGYRNGWLTTPPTILSGSKAAFSANNPAFPYTPANIGYGDYQWEPSRDGFVSIDGKFPLTDTIDLQVTPYFLHHLSGSSTEVLLKENGYTNKFLSSPVGAFTAYGTANTNALLVQMSQNEFDRVGNTATLTGRFGEHTISGGLWAEYTHQHQLNPFQQIDPLTNTIADIFFQSHLIRDNKGHILTSRDWVTDYYNTTLSLSDSIALFDDRLHIDLSGRERIYDRTFHNLPSGNSNLTDAYLDYKVKRNYSFFLPSFGVRYDLDEENQVFFNASMSARVPPNFADGRLVDNTKNTVSIRDLKAENSLSFDTGYRYKGDLLNVNATAFLIKYSDRIAVTIKNDATLSSKYTNIGSTTAVGGEIELGTKPYEGWSVLVSQAINDDTLDSDIKVEDGSKALPTKGKQYFNAPKYITNATLMYEDGPLYGFARAKWTSSVFATLTNDIRLPGYTTVDLGLGYKLKGTAFLDAIPGAQDGEFKLNLTNILNSKYLYINPGNSTGVQISSAGTPFFYLGAPFSVVASLSLDF
ncbi:TonB-dependent receptor [Methylobacterium sp. E-066]|uniref:TonB-dependent receptor n=1 Tax=Methylobacterium sp. E-066 TaxID=2836584 RepID=UPI001FB88623|nr:TonB-dependent receptor [Methylobacterium sp. E-066]MCJ2141607.1 TonB-dependent receptor [Methylobacterium sp. E-066]